MSRFSLKNEAVSMTLAQTGPDRRAELRLTLQSWLFPNLVELDKIYANDLLKTLVVFLEGT